jgi:hypothetical protein
MHNGSVRKSLLFKYLAGQPSPCHFSCAFFPSLFPPSAGTYPVGAVTRFHTSYWFEPEDRVAHAMLAGLDCKELQDRQPLGQLLLDQDVISEHKLELVLRQRLATGLEMWRVLINLNLSRSDLS